MWPPIGRVRPGFLGHCHTHGARLFDAPRSPIRRGRPPSRGGSANDCIGGDPVNGQDLTRTVYVEDSPAAVEEWTLPSWRPTSDAKLQRSSLRQRFHLSNIRGCIQERSRACEMTHL